MIYALYADKDTTLYESTSSLNTGIDQILELRHTVIPSLTSGSFQYYNSRILAKFNTELIRSYINDGSIVTGSSTKYYLSMRTVQASEIPVEYTVMVHPLSSSWSNGTGRYSNKPQTTNGSSWVYRTSKQTGTQWNIPVLVSSYTWDEVYQMWVDSNFYFGSGGESQTVTSSYCTTKGGGTWYFGNTYDVSQSFSYATTDLFVDVTKIVNRWLSGSNYISNDGFIIKYSNADERSSEDYGSIKFYSTDSNTIYVPRLLVCWDDSSFVTGSLSRVSGDDLAIHPKIKKTYRQDEKPKIRIHSRKRFPQKNWVTESPYMEVKYLPSSSYWELRDALTNEAILPFDTTATKISCDASGSYMNLWMEGLQPDRFYKLVFKVIDGGNVLMFDDGYQFKVVR